MGGSIPLASLLPPLVGMALVVGPARAGP